MVAIKPAQAETFLKAPPTSCTGFLLFGNDPGLISERAKTLATRLAERGSPPGEVLRLTDSDLDEDPSRLGVELQTQPMFSGCKVVRATASRRVNGALLKPIIELAPLDGIIVLEASSLKPNDSLRALFEKHPNCAAIGCYGDSTADLNQLITEVVSGAGMTMTADGRSALLDRLGADRALSRAEIEKLTLFAMGRDSITEQDVDAIVGDAADLTLERIAEAAAAGNARQAVTDLGRAVASGDDAQVVVLITQRFFTKLHGVRSEVDAGARIEDALRALRPPLHFSQRPTFSQLIRVWSRPALNQALARISETARAARLSSRLDEAHAERLMLALAAMANQQANRHASSNRGQ